MECESDRYTNRMECESDHYSNHDVWSVTYGVWERLLQYITMTCGVWRMDCDIGHYGNYDAWRFTFLKGNLADLQSVDQAWGSDGSLHSTVAILDSLCQWVSGADTGPLYRL